MNVNANTVRDVKGSTRDPAGHTLTPFYLTPGATSSVRENAGGSGLGNGTGASAGENGSNKGGQGNAPSRFFKEMVLKPGT